MRAQRTEGKKDERGIMFTIDKERERERERKKERWRTVLLI